MKSEEIFEKLRLLAPSIAFSVSRERDLDYSWCGDGDDPTENGFDAYLVTVKAQIVFNGELVEEKDYLGGCYFKEDEPLDDVNGYLPQMLENVATDLCEKLSSSPHAALSDLFEVIEFLKNCTLE